MPRAKQVGRTVSVSRSGKFLWSAVASGIPRDTAFVKPQKAVPRTSSDVACHRTPKRAIALMFFGSSRFVEKRYRKSRQFCVASLRMPLHPSKRRWRLSCVAQKSRTESWHAAKPCRKSNFTDGLIDLPLEQQGFCTRDAK
jgi:hypothetical protein